MSANQPTNTPAPDWRELRRQERAARRASRDSSGAWLLGVVLIGVGIFLFLQNWYGMILQNWWALFILLPAAGCLVASWRVWREEGGALSLRLLAPLVIGLMLLALTLIFLFGYAVNWWLVLPVLLIGFGILVMLTSFFRLD